MASTRSVVRTALCNLILGVHCAVGQGRNYASWRGLVGGIQKQLGCLRQSAGFVYSSTYEIALGVGSAVQGIPCVCSFSVTDTQDHHRLVGEAMSLLCCW